MTYAETLRQMSYSELNCALKDKEEEIDSLMVDKSIIKAAIRDKQRDAMRRNIGRCFYSPQKHRAFKIVGEPRRWVDRTLSGGEGEECTYENYYPVLIFNTDTGVYPADISVMDIYTDEVYFPPADPDSDDLPQYRDDSEYVEISSEKFNTYFNDTVSKLRRWMLSVRVQ